MESRDHKRAALHKKLQLLRSVTNSEAENTTSIIVDATKYIQELKQKVESLKQETTPTTSNVLAPTQVTVETQERGFQINVISEKSCPGLLLCILEAFEEIRLDVLEARVSCNHTFHLEAVGGDNQDESMDAQVVKQAVLQAIKNCTE